MSAKEYVPGPSLQMVDKRVRDQGWRPAGRAAWQTGGVLVQVLSLLDQIYSLEAGQPMNVVGFDNDFKIDLARLDLNIVWHE